MKIFLVVLITIIVVVGIFYFIGINQQKTILVTNDGPASNGVGNYYLYVPGDGRSTCTWTWNASGTPQSLTTQPNTQTGQHQFIYNSSVSDIAVTCITDQNVKYTGQF